MNENLVLKKFFGLKFERKKLLPIMGCVEVQWGATIKI